MIALHLHASSGEAQDKEDHLSLYKGIELLVGHLDVVYNDPEAWIQLCDAYEQLGMCVPCALYSSNLAQSVTLAGYSNAFHV